MPTYLDDVIAALHFDARDQQRLATLHGRLAPELAAIAERFYTAVQAVPNAGAAFTSDVMWLTTGLLGPYDRRFTEHRAQTGVGLSQRFVVAAMNLLRSEYDERIREHFTGDEAAQIKTSVDKLLDLELAIMLRRSEARAATDRVLALQTLSAGLAHEVRNPLNSAKLQLELLERRLRRESSAPRLLEPLALAQQEIERLTRMLHDFLAFAHPADLSLGQHDVVAIARDVVEAERPLATARGANVELVADGAIMAHVDPAKIHQILQNLVRNAIEAVTHAGKVTVALRSDHDNIRFRIDDDGPGIPDAVRARIYEPFFSTKDSGTGLGMAIVHSMVTLHGGTIAIDSNATGTRCEVALPR